MRRHCVLWHGARRRAAACLLLGLVAGTACTTSGSARYARSSERWQRSETPGRFADPGETLFAGATALDRGELVRLVLARNPTVRAARYAWRAALERYPQVRALDDPMLGVGVAPRSFGSNEVDDGYRFDLSQSLPFPGKLRLRGEAALAEAEAAAHDFAAVRLRIARMASLLFDDYYYATRSVEINAEHVALLDEFKRIATARYEVGEASQQDPIQAEVELAHALHRELVLETGRRVVAEQINALLHRLPDGPLPTPPSRAVVAAELDAPVEDLVVRALAERPELAAAGARVAAEEARVDLALREYFPDFTLVGAYDRIWQERELQPFVGVELNVPLQLGRRRAALAEAEARLEQMRSERAAIEDEIRFAAHSGAERLTEAHHVMELVRDRLLPAARDQVEAARAGFETGRNSLLALIDAERNLRNVELEYEEALADLGRRRAELEHALGRTPGLDW
jgi:outer membrane protein TolC